MPSIDEFIRTGRLGPIRCGMSQDEVQEILGEPDVFTRGRYRSILRYGSMQLGFYKGHGASEPRLSAINLYFHDPTSGIPGPIGLTGWIPTDRTTLGEMREYIPDHVEEKGRDARESGSITVSLGRGMKAIFDEGRLYGLHYEEKTGPRLKQLSIFVPEEVLDLIRKEAEERGDSIGDVCSRWLADRAREKREAMIP